ncbi:MAG: response regulator [Myxococcota bacterium]
MARQFNHRSGTVLIVDDDETVRLTLSVALREVADRVMLCENAEDAMGVLERCHVDLLCVDKNLPGMTGLQFVASVRQRDAAIGILVITGYSTLQSARTSLDLGVDGYVEKPFDVEDLLLTCQTTLARTARRRESIRREGESPAINRALALAPHDLLAASLERVLKEASLDVIKEDSVELPDLVVAALDGPRGTSARVSEVRRRYPAAELIILSPLFDIPMVTSLIELGVAGTLDLPYRAEALRSHIERIRHGSRSVEEFELLEVNDRF